MAKNLSIRFSAASSAAAISSSSSDSSGNTPSMPSVPSFNELPTGGGGSSDCVVTTNTVVVAATAVAPAPSLASSASEASSSSPVTVHSASAASTDIDIIQLSAEVKKGSGGAGGGSGGTVQTWSTVSCDSAGDKARPNGHDYVTVVSSGGGRSTPSAGKGSTGGGSSSSSRTMTTMSSSMSRSSSVATAATKESPDKDETSTLVSTPQQQHQQQPASAVSSKNSSGNNRSNKSSPTVGSKVDRFVRQLQESFTSSSSSSKAETPTATMSWCKFAKGAEGVASGGAAALEIISGGSQTAAESDDSLVPRERVSITLTPAAAVSASPFSQTGTPASTMTTSSSGSKSPSAASAAYNSWLADMKTFKEKWSKAEKTEKSKSGVAGGDEFSSSLSSLGNNNGSTPVTTSSSATITTISSSPSCSSSANQVTVSNAYLNNNYYLVNNNSHVCTGGSSTTCSSCSAPRRTAAAAATASSTSTSNSVQAPSTLPVQSFGGSVYCATCLTTTNSDHHHHHHHHNHHQQQQTSSKCNAISASNATPQRTPTPPLLLSPNEVVFDPNFDPYLVGETSRDNTNMIFSFGRSSSSSEKKEKKDKDKEGKPSRAKLFTGSSSSQSKEKDAAAAAAASKKKSKEKERDKEKDKEKDTSNSFFKINTSRSSSVSSPSSANISSSNLTASFLLGLVKNNTSPSQSRYSSQENISINNSDNLNWSKNNNNNNIPKSVNTSSTSSKQLSSSRSMISFRKLTKNGENESEVTFDDLDLSTTYNQDTRHSFGPQPPNPTLRRKGDSFRRNDSPTATESGGHFSLLEGDTMSMASSKSTNSNSSASALFNRSNSISTADLSSLGTPSSDPPRQSPTARQRISQLSHAVLPSSWATCIAYVYYIFALVVALLSLLISLISPLPAFFNGLVLGFVCTFLLVTVVIIYIVSHYVLVKSPESDEDKQSGLRSHLSGESISLKRSFNRPKLSTNSLITAAAASAGFEGDLYSGWVYEFIGDYEEREKNGFLSQLVHVVLRGTRLIIYTPAQELNEKKLKALLAAESSGGGGGGGGGGSSASNGGNNNSSNSSKAQQNVTFASQRVIEFSRQSRKPRVSLLLTKNVRNQRKYVWSKKYPISLEFVDDRATNGGGYIVVGKTNDDTPSVLRGGSSSSSNESSSSLVETATIPLPATTFPSPSSSTSPVPLKLVLFARSCREKEEWFWAMKMAVDMASKGGSTDVSPKSSNLNIADSTSTTQLSTTIASTTTASEQTDDSFNNSSAQQYLRILTRRINYSAFMRANVLNSEGLGATNMQNPLTWFNVLLNRLSFDILNKPNWSAYIAKKLQRKLRKLRLPYFMESLTITEIDIGTTLPKFNSVPTAPVIDDAGLWIDFDVSYSGGFTMTLETKLNLMKLKKAESSAAVESISLSTLSAAESGMHSSGVNTPTLESPLVSPTATSLPKQMKHWCGYKFRTSTVSSVTSNASASGGVAAGVNFETAASVDSDSDLDSIGTSSEDEEPETAPADPDDADTDEKQRKLIRFVNKIASSQYFQKATQINFFKKAIEGVSKMSIMLTVQINSLSGTLAINIPESPSDRLWYGFRNDPTFQITARPKVGDHDLNLHYVTNFIEKKLRAEFFNYFVIPHMDDFYIPALNANIEQYVSVVP